MKWLLVFSMSSYLKKLEQIKKDDMQYKAYNSDDSTVVIAGPGSGKTTVLTLKIMRLLLEKITEPRGLACVTYSNEAARSFELRLHKLGFKGRKNIFLGTVHSFCLSEVLANYAHLYDYGIPYPIKIISMRQKESLYRSVLYDFRIDEKVVSLADMDKERTLNINGMSAIEIPSYEIALMVAIEYEKRLSSLGFLDFESIIKYSTLLIQEREYVRKCLSAKFPWLLIDEYQDLGRPLHEMVLSLFTSTDIKVFAVGDPDQSIYSFSGAIPDYLIELYSRSDIIPIALKNNYRSNQDIVDSSELVLDSKRNYKAVTRTEESAEFHFITCEEDLDSQFICCVDEIIPYCIEKKIPLEEIAILVKDKYGLRSIAEIFRDRNIPYYIAKHEYDRTDFVKWLELCASWVGDKTSTSFDELFYYWKKVLIRHGSNGFLNEDNSIIEKRSLYKILTESYKYRNSISKWLKNIINNLNVNSLLHESSIYPDETNNLAKLLVVASNEEYLEYDISKFSKLGKPENQVTLTTRHSSKGLEFEVIVMTGMEEGRFPDYRSFGSSKKYAEERRICFVCVSRAKKVCFLMRSKYNNIKTKNGIWRKEEEPSQFWVQLYNKHGYNL